MDTEETPLEAALAKAAVEPAHIVSVYISTAERWLEVAPAWAKQQWSVLHRQLQAWCAELNIPLRIDATANVTAVAGNEMTLYSKHDAQ